MNTIHQTRKFRALGWFLAGLTIFLFIGASVLFAAIMGAALWILLRKTAFLPLEKALDDARRMNETLEQKLREQTREWMKTDAIIAAMGDGVSIQDTAFKVLYQNQVHKDIIGDHVGEYCYRAYEQQTDVCDGCPLAKSFADGRIHTEPQSAMTDKGMVHVEVTTSPVRDASGRIIAGVEIVRNIMRRKQSELALLERSRHAMLGADVGVALTKGRDLPQILQACAEAQVRHLDAYFARIWTLNEAEGMLELQASAGAYTRLDGSHGRISLEEYQFKIGGIARERKPYITNTVIGNPQFSDQEWAKRDEIVAFAGHPLVVEDKLVGVMGLFAQQELSAATLLALSSIADTIALGIERKRMEKEQENLIQELQKLIETVTRSRKEWRDTFDSIQDPIYITDADYQVVKANRAFIEFTGLSFQEVLSKKCYELIHGASNSDSHCPYDAMKKRGTPVAIEFAQDAGKKTLIISHFPYFSPEGEFGGSISIIRDVTDEREKEMKSIMNERLASLGQMAASIAHEINNPLAAIMGCSEGLLSRVRQERYDAPFFLNYLAIIQEEIVRCKNITTGMLSFVRTNAPEKTIVDLRATLERTLEIFGFQSKMSEVHVEKRYAPGIHLVQGNEGELKQVFLTVLNNALDAMGDKGTLTIAIGAEGASAFVSFTDTGPGIPDEHINRVFDPFFTTKTDKGGTGLGLSIARKIIDNHDGSIDVASGERGGATFTIRLPMPDSAFMRSQKS